MYILKWLSAQLMDLMVAPHAALSGRLPGCPVTLIAGPGPLSSAAQLLVVIFVSCGLLGRGIEHHAFDGFFFFAWSSDSQAPRQGSWAAMRLCRQRLRPVVCQRSFGQSALGPTSGWRRRRGLPSPRLRHRHLSVFSIAVDLCVVCLRFTLF